MKSAVQFVRNSVLCVLLGVCAAASAQGRGPGGGPGGGGPGGPGGGGRPHPGGMSDGDTTVISRPGSSVAAGMGGGFGSFSREPASRQTSTSAPHAVVEVGPPGRWWDDKKFAGSIGLQEDQRKRMDAVFNENKGPLSTSYTNLKREENALNKLVNNKQPDEEKIMEQIDHVAAARAELEKSATRMLLALRRELSKEQASKLEAKTRAMQQQAEDDTQ